MIRRSDPPPVMRWLTRAPDVIAYAVLAAAILWALDTSSRITRVEARLDEIKTYLMPARGPETNEGVRHANR